MPSIELFQKLLPDLYQRVCMACVPIKVIEQVVADGRCMHGFDCPRGTNCHHKHSKEQKKVLVNLKPV